MSISITLTNELSQALVKDGLDPQSYGPAYDGESVGLDLYNAGDDLVIPSFTKIALDTATQNSLLLDKYAHEYSPITSKLDWVDLPEELRKDIFKVFIPSGVKIALPKNHVALLRERGSVTKTPLVLRAGVIDPGYTGEIFINAVNLSNTDYVIKSGAKTPFQLVVLPVVTKFSTVPAEEYKQVTSGAARTEGKIGSTD